MYDNSEHSEPGEIGCDYLKEEWQCAEDVKWRESKAFDIKLDKQIGRELPLPSKKGTESGEITATTAAANATAMEVTKPSVTPR